MDLDDSVRFLNLPMELRLIIYEYAFASNASTKIRQRPPPWIQRYKAPGILLANKDIYLEATPIFYRSTTFEVCFSLTDWLKKLPSVHSNEISKTRYAEETYYQGSIVKAIRSFKEEVKEAINVDLAEGVLYFSRGGIGRHKWMNELGKFD